MGSLQIKYFLEVLPITYLWPDGLGINIVSVGNIFLVITILGWQYWSNIGGIWHVGRQLIRSSNMIHILGSVQPRNYLRPENVKIFKNCIEKILKGVVQVESIHWQGDRTKFDLFVMPPNTPRPRLNWDFHFRFSVVKAKISSKSNK